MRILLIDFDVILLIFRDYNTAANTTYHYGDLTLDGGSNGPGWGWLNCNQINNTGSITSNGSYNIGSSTVTENLIVHGALSVWGTKNFIHPHPTDSTKVIKYICIEAGEALTLARGTAKTVNGTVEIPLPEHFTLVTSATAPITVIVTPEKAPAVLYVKEKSAKSIKIGMKSEDLFEYGDVDFSYQVTGVRDGFEGEEVIVDEADLFKERVAKQNNEVKKRIEERTQKAMKVAKETMAKRGKSGK